MASQYANKLLDLGEQAWNSVKDASAPYIGDQTAFMQGAGKLGFNNSITNPVQPSVTPNLQQNAQTTKSLVGSTTDWLTGKGAKTPDASQYIKPIMDLNYSGIKNAPGFNPGSMNTSPIQTVSPYQMSKDLSNGYQPQTNEWANNGIKENQQRFDSASQNWQNTRNQLGNVSVGNALLLSMDMNQQRQLMKQSNQQLSEDKKYASSNLENNNQLGMTDLNARRTADLQSQNTNNEINRINMQNSNSAWERNLQTYTANQNADQVNNANIMGRNNAILQYNKEIPALQQTQARQQILQDLARTGDTRENRTNDYLQNQKAYQQAINTGDVNMRNSLENDYRKSIEKAQANIYNNPAYGLLGLTNPRANTSQAVGKISKLDKDGNQIEIDKLGLDSPLLAPLTQANNNQKQVLANPNVPGGYYTN